MAATIHQIEDFRQQTDFGRARSPQPIVTNPYEGDRGRAHSGGAAIDDVYPEPEVIGRDLSSALELLDEAVTFVNEALEFERNGHSIQADDAIQRMQMVLPELFACRSIGDGYGAVVSAIFHGLRNHRGDPLSEKQMLGLRTALMTVRHEPFRDFDGILAPLEQLRALGFNIMPKGIEVIGDALDDLSGDGEIVDNGNGIR